MTWEQTKEKRVMSWTQLFQWNTNSSLSSEWRCFVLLTTRFYLQWENSFKCNTSRTEINLVSATKNQHTFFFTF